MSRVIKYHDLELTELELDALGEICNIGMGHAATALNQMIGKPIRLSIPSVDLVSLSEVPDKVGGAEQVVAGIFLKIWGDIKGNILLIFPQSSVRSICAMLTGGGKEEGPELSEMHASALMEVGNIIASSYLSALEKLLEKTLFPSVPAVAFDMAGAVLEYVLIQLGQEVDRILLIEATFSNLEDEIQGSFFLLPDAKSLEIMLQAAKVGAPDKKL
jgi:chemotaxis protein CheC